MESTRASSKGQMVIPKSIRDALDIRAGTELSVELLPGKGFKVSLKPTDHVARVRELAGSLAHLAKPMTVEEEERAIIRIVGADDERTKSHRGKR